jgi:RNase adapter protein RapZ
LKAGVKLFKGRFVIITGFSGAGKSGALHSFEDLGFFSMDNLPPALIPKFAELCLQSGGKINRVALVCDIRGGELFSGLFEALNKLEEMGFDYEILFLEAAEDVLIRRFKETRRRHPLSERGNIVESISEESSLLEEIRGKADVVIDTTELATADLKEKIYRLYAPEKWEKNIFINVISFGYKYGLPLDADLVFDVRFLPNPHYVDSLRHLDGNNQLVSKYVWKWAITHRFYQKLKDLIQFLIPCYIKEGKPELVIAIGCTGGKHRSVSLSNELSRLLTGEGYQSRSEHRDINKA